LTFLSAIHVMFVAIVCNRPHNPGRFMEVRHACYPMLSSAGSIGITYFR
jgi:hypothetical protein